MVEYNTRAVDLERDSATAKIAQRQKSAGTITQETWPVTKGNLARRSPQPSAGTIRQAAWPVARGRAKPPPRTRPPHPCRGLPRHIHPVGTVEQDQSTLFHTFEEKQM